MLDINKRSKFCIPVEDSTGILHWEWRGPKRIERGTRRMRPAAYVYTFAGGDCRRRHVIRTCSYPGCVLPTHQRIGVYRPYYGVLTPEAAAAIRAEYLVIRAEVERLIAAPVERSTIHKLAVRRDNRLRRFFESMSQRYSLGLSTVRFAAYGVRTGNRTPLSENPTPKSLDAA